MKRRVIRTRRESCENFIELGDKICRSRFDSIVSCYADYYDIGIVDGSSAWIFGPVEEMLTFRVPLGMKMNE